MHFNNCFVYIVDDVPDIKARILKAISVNIPVLRRLQRTTEKRALIVYSALIIPTRSNRRLG